MARPDPVEQINALDAVWSPDLDDYATGQLDASKIRCALCQCPPFGSPEYLALIDQRHGRR